TQLPAGLVKLLPARKGGMPGGAAFEAARVGGGAPRLAERPAGGGADVSHHRRERGVEVRRLMHRTCQLKHEPHLVGSAATLGHVARHHDGVRDRPVARVGMEADVKMARSRAGKLKSLLVMDLL